MQLNGHAAMKHQAEYVRLCREHPRFGVFADTGTGKTFVGCALIEEAYPVRALVVCPKALIEGAWRIDCEKFVPRIPFLNLHDVPKAKRKRALKGFVGVAVINYESFKSSLQDLYDWRPDLVILDESSKLKAHNSAISKQMKLFCQQMPRVYLMSGTPAPNTELEWWTQASILGVGWGKSYHAWKTRVAVSCGYGGHEWRVTAAGREAIKRDLAPHCWHVHKEDVLDLPERTHVTRPVDLSPEEWDAYRAMAATAVARIDGHDVEAPHTLTQLAKLRQGTSGFMYMPNAEDVLPMAVWAGSSKLSALADLLDEIGANTPVVVWAHYAAEYEAIALMLGRRVLPYHGRVSDAGRSENLKDWLAGKAPVLLASPASIGHGVTLTRASYMVWFSGSYSYEQYHQANDRIYRYGQRNACTYYHLVVPGTIDEVVLDVVQKKAKVSARTLEFLKGTTRDTGVRA